MDAASAIMRASATEEDHVALDRRHLRPAPLDRRRAFIVAWIAVHDSVAELAMRFRISRKTAYKFIDRSNSSATPTSTTSSATPVQPPPNSPR